MFMLTIKLKGAYFLCMWVGWCGGGHSLPTLTQTFCIHDKRTISGERIWKYLEK